MLMSVSLRVCVCVCGMGGAVGDKRRRLHSLFQTHPPQKRGSDKLGVKVQRSSTPRLSWIVLIIILAVLRGLVLVEFPSLVAFRPQHVNSKQTLILNCVSLHISHDNCFYFFVFQMKPFQIVTIFTADS